MKSPELKDKVTQGKEIVHEAELPKKPFRQYTLDKDKKETGIVIVTMKLNMEEQGQLIKDKKLLQQTKNSTAIKQLWLIGSKVLHEPKTKEIITTIIDNKRKNERSGISESE